MAKGKKRANGEGTWYQLADKTWVHQITIGEKGDGTLKRKSFSGATKAICTKKKAEWEDRQRDEKYQMEHKEAEQRAAENAILQLGHSLESQTLFEEAFTNWLQLYKAPPTKKASTYASYVDIFKTHFVPAFGEMPLYAITQDVVQEYYNSKQLNGGRKDGKKGGLSPKTIRNHHMLLKDFFDFASVKYKLIGNPTSDTSRPEVITPNVRVLDSDEMGIFLQEVMRETQRIAILTGLFTGLRKGELLSLEINDLNLKRQSISINKSLLRVKTLALSLDNPQIKILNYNPNKQTHLILQKSPKTSSSVREIFISDALCELLIRHLFTLQHSTWPNPDNLLFSSTTGTYIDPKSFEIRLAAVSKRCEIRKVNPHALRHTLASRLVDQDVPLSVVKDILGHASIQTTQKYLHKDSEKEREAMESVTDAYIDFGTLTDAPRLNGAKKRAKFADVQLPTFSDMPSSKEILA